MTLVNSKILMVIAISAPKNIFDADFKFVIIFFVARIVFEICMFWLPVT